MHTELSRWHDWTDPDFFNPDPDAEKRVVPLFLRQMMPTRVRRTRLTLAGWFLILVALGIGTAAYNTASNILFMTLSLLLSSLVLSGILSHINFRKLTWSLRPPEHLRAGEVAMAELQVKNAKVVFPSFCLRFELYAGLCSEPDWLSLPHELSPGQSTKLDWTFTPLSRGHCQVRVTGVESEFPFGFLSKTLAGRLEERLLVWPARLEYSFDPKGAGWRQRAESSRKRAGHGSDLLHIREYVRGDAPRSIHWKATARAGKLMVRQFAREGINGFHLYLDPSPEAWTPEGFEALCCLAGSLAEDLFQSGRLESVQVAGHAQLAIKSNRQLYEFFDLLAELELHEYRGAVPSAATGSLVQFRPSGSKGVAIYIEDERVGQTDD